MNNTLMSMIVTLSDVMLTVMAISVLAVLIIKVTQFCAPKWLLGNKYQEGMSQSEFKVFMESWLVLLDLINSIAPYVGLAGTMAEVVIFLSKEPDLTVLDSHLGSLGSALSHSLYGTVCSIFAIVCLISLNNISEKKIEAFKLGKNGNTTSGESVL